MFVKSTAGLPYVVLLLRSRRRGRPDLASVWLGMISARDQSLIVDHFGLLL
jgi:hypothetical protein